MDDKGFAETMAQNAHTLVVNEHTLEKEAAAFQDVYKKIMRIKTS
jgi:prolyl-tRNA synthetase